MPWNQHFDGRGVHYSKAEIDELFAANSDGDDSKMGLRIYIAMHGESTEENFEMPKRPPHYIGQHTTILVCTKDGKDILSPGKFVTIYESKVDRGLALDEGQICPPPKCDTII